MAELQRGSHSGSQSDCQSARLHTAAKVVSPESGLLSASKSTAPVAVAAVASAEAGCRGASFVAHLAVREWEAAATRANGGSNGQGCSNLSCGGSSGMRV